MGNETFILSNDGEVIREPDTLRWAQWFETHTKDRILAHTEVHRGERVSTVFLGLDHSFGGKKPILWETMVFGGPLDLETKRYHSREAALKGHEVMVERVKQAHAPC